MRFARFSPMLYRITLLMFSNICNASPLLEELKKFLLSWVSWFCILRLPRDRSSTMKCIGNLELFWIMLLELAVLLLPTVEDFQKLLLCFTCHRSVDTANLWLNWRTHFLLCYWRCSRGAVWNLSVNFCHHVGSLQWECIFEKTDSVRYLIQDENYSVTDPLFFSGFLHIDSGMSPEWVRSDHELVGLKEKLVVWTRRLKCKSLSKWTPEQFFCRPTFSFLRHLSNLVLLLSRNICIQHVIFPGTFLSFYLMMASNFLFFLRFVSLKIYCMSELPLFFYFVLLRNIIF